MTTQRFALATLLFVFLFGGCSSTRHVTAIPPDLDRTRVPTQTFVITAERFQFSPREIHVEVGTLVRLDVKSINGTHGFTLSAFGIDETLKEGKTKIIELYVKEKGEYPFRCSHFCGFGHFGMSGKIVVE